MYRSRPNDAKPLVNVPDGARGMTPLHYACSDGNKERVEQLLLAGAKREARYTALLCKMVDRLAARQMSLVQRKGIYVSVQLVHWLKHHIRRCRKKTSVEAMLCYMKRG